MHSLLIGRVTPGVLRKLRRHLVFAWRTRRDSGPGSICEVFGYAHGTEVTEQLPLASLSVPRPMGQLLAQLNHALSRQTDALHLFKMPICLF